MEPRRNPPPQDALFSHITSLSDTGQTFLPSTRKIRNLVVLLNNPCQRNFSYMFLLV